MSDLPAIEQFTSSTGVDIYRIPVVVFPNGFIAYCHLLLGAGVPTLVDTGSGFGRSSDDLFAGLQAVRDGYGVPIEPGDIRRVLITHGHVDHSGGLAGVLKAVAGDAQVGIHPLDKRVLTHYEERVVVATKNLTIYLQRAGVRHERLQQLLEMYGFSKQHVRSVRVDFTVEEGAELDGMRFYHTPGHCSGQVCIQLGDILLSADHILPRTSPHLAAESITHYTGVGHYREALAKIRAVDGIRLALGGHETPLTTPYERIDYLQWRIDEKLAYVLDLIEEAGRPLTINEISKRMYPDKHGFEVLLAIQEAGAYVEYLYEHGHLAIANLHEYEDEHNAALLYAVIRA